MAVPYVCAKCGARLPTSAANGGSECASCGTAGDPVSRRVLLVEEWFILVAAVLAGIGALINS